MAYTPAECVVRLLDCCTLGAMVLLGDSPIYDLSQKLHLCSIYSSSPDMDDSIFSQRIDIELALELIPAGIRQVLAQMDAHTHFSYLSPLTSHVSVS